jgi:hypothetical protein
MLKNLTILALTLCVLSVQTHAQPDKAQQTHKGDNPSFPTATVVPQDGNSPSLQTESKNHVDADVRVISAPNKDGYERIAFWANLALVAVGIGGIVVAVCTMKKIERQTKAAQDSITLQETAFSQWVELMDWSSEISGDARNLTVRVDLVNSTNFPLTLRSVCITLQLETEAHLICKDRVLPPNEPVRMSVAIALTELQIATFRGDGIGIFVKGGIEFTSILKRSAAQNFQGLLLCDTKGTVFEYTIP